MVKVLDDEAAAMAEPPAPQAAVPPPSRHHKAAAASTRHHHHHLHHTPLQHFHHFHHHWTYPDSGAPCPAAGPATFHFGPGFEPQQPLPSRYGSGPSQTSPQTQNASTTTTATANPNEHIVHFHVNPGVTVSFQIGENIELIRGPVTVPMVSTNSSPPIAMPVQVPPGHVVQQIVDESGTLRHVILSPQPPLVPMPHSHNPPHYAGPANGNNQPPQTFYQQGLPPGYPPPPHYHSNMPPGHLVPPGGHLGHSPPPAHGFHKDERTQRQYNKLKRKLEQKRTDVGGGGGGLTSGPNTPLLSPRKELVNGLRRGAAKERGMNSVGTSEDGEESSSVQDDEDEVNVITDILSSVQSPQVSELSSRSALLHWSVPSRLSTAASNGSQDPVDISESDLRYDVLLSDKGKEGKYKSIYSGASLSCRIQDLKPGQEYSVCLQVHLDELQGSASDPITFTTPPCEPDTPPPLKLISRNKTSLQLRWNAAADNGSHILQYILEYDEGKGGGFVELSKYRGKQFNVTKLQPSTVYRFRLAAVNECGKSPYTDVMSFTTSGSPPAQPSPPLLKEASIDSLRLVWVRRPTDDDFTLQIDNMQSGYGFLNAYVGKETEYLCEKLTRYSDYKFRLRAHNEESPSVWSEEVCYRTLPDRPGQPARPTVKGRIHAHSFKLRWERPHDQGGADITTYILELSSGSGYETVYTGPETETVCDKLAPGTTYQLRLSCISAGGRSNYSDLCTVTTEPVCPGKCTNLRTVGKPRATCLSLKWTEPDNNGGAPVTEYELDLVDPDQPIATVSARHTVYKGRDSECTVANLQPGNEYSFIVRAVNRVGASAWSDMLSISSGAAAPDIPTPPLTTAKSPFHVYVEWQEPPCNGAPLTEYKLEMSNTDQEEQYAAVFQGLATSYDVKGLTPFTTYFFRVQACNTSGCSMFSQVSATMTPASTPAVMSAPRYDATPNSLTLYWHEPAANGAEILHYIIELGDKVVVTTDGPATEHTIENLKAETAYKIKVKAVNNIGAGAYSPVLKACTLPLPPPAPKLDCIGAGHNYLKLKWGDGKNSDFTQYCVEMENNRTKEFQCIYQGTNYTYKVNKLQELSTYKFRISASSDAAGQGEFSSVYEFKTCIAPPAGLKAPKVIEVTQRTCSLEWTPCRMQGCDPIEYSVQMSRLRDQDFKQVYRGPEFKYTLVDLEPGSEYNVRVCPIRLASIGELPGAYSPSASFLTSASDPVLSTKQSTPLVTSSPTRGGRKNQRLFSWLMGGIQHHSDKKPMSDQQWAIVIILGFIVFAFVAAVFVEQLFINWRKSV